MQCARKITEDVYWVGVNDRRLNLFENIFPVKRGVSYNSYIIMDEKTALMDTVDAGAGQQFIENVQYILNGRKLDYLIINHMEPDHCANIENLVHLYPEVILVGNAKTFQMIGQFFEFSLEERSLLVKEKDTLSIGKHELTFVMAPMVHWPEVMVTYDSFEKILFSADAFGSFGALNGTVFADEVDFDRDWLDDARRYYTNIVGKYGAQVQALLKKAATLDIQMICPLHGPVWRENLDYFMNKHDLWSRYEPEVKGVAIMYASMYGNTESAVNALAAMLAEDGVSKLAVYDISVTHISELISEAFKYSHIILASPTYNGNAYPLMHNLLYDMKALNLSNRTFALMENGTWAAASGKQMRTMLEELKNSKVLESVFTMKSAAKNSQMDQMIAFKDAIKASLEE
ncbi:MAG: FprA family A-type flavoprotein [Clostridia bacterium]|nr:FprA family A-type flavoprotein [Lachnospiraceae bacterium]NCC00279.1 FprA family A-type flavoprotein [Clostridia bacterium]NCD02303.1 FprA family A-type flavoprotein [Clostridia bacterium]